MFYIICSSLTLYPTSDRKGGLPWSNPKVAFSYWYQKLQKIKNATSEIISTHFDTTTVSTKSETINLHSHHKLHGFLRAPFHYFSFTTVVSVMYAEKLFMVHGGFQLLDLIIPELKSHVIPYKFKCSHWWKINL